MIDLDRTPSRRELVVFAASLPVVLGIVGALRWHAGSPRAAIAIWIVGSLVSLAAWLAPGARLRLWRGWMRLVAPIAWVVSHVALLAIWSLVVTPIAVVLRAIGRDPMCRRFEREARTYWIEREPARERSRYFRQS